MGDIIVKYNNVRIFPTPLVNRSYEMIDLGGARWGNVNHIELVGVITGISSTGDYTLLTSIFNDNFGTLSIADTNTTIYNWNNIVVEDITFDNSHWFLNTTANYKIKLKSYNFPSGVIDASNQYDFTQNEDGTVNVSHKISAKGVKTIAGSLDNAIALVNLFTGKNPYTNCVPAFIPNGKGVLINLTENLDRLNQVYTVTEAYKFTTGSTLDYYTIENLNINESANQEYVNLDYQIKYVGSPVSGNLSAITTDINATNYITLLNTKYGIDSTNLYKNTVSISQDTGASSIDVKFNFVSGLSSFDVNGFFDYSVSLEEDSIRESQVWKIDGQFVGKGPLSLRLNNLATWKSNTISNNGSYESYLSNLITNSVVYGNYGTISIINPRPINFTWDENTGLATLKLSATFNNNENPFSLINPKYELQIEPEKWIFELLPSANIEGHYVIQDLQMKSKPKLSLNISAGTSGAFDYTLNSLDSIISALSGGYIVNGFVSKQNVNSGFNEVAKSYEFIADSIPSSSLLTNLKVFGSFATDYTRPKGYDFGY